MRTSLTELKEIDEHLFKTSAPEEECLFQAKLILDSELSEKVILQTEAHQLIRQYSRRKLKEDIGLAEARFFSDTSNSRLINLILSLFKA